MTEQIYRYTYECNLAGARVGDREEMVLALKPGEELLLDREPDNRHDPNAVAVYARGVQVGYLPASRAELIADFMDHGKEVQCRVLDVHDYELDDGETAYGARLFIGAIPEESSEEPREEKPGWAERMISAGDNMEKAGASVSSAGCSITMFVIALVALAVIALVFWAVAC